MAPVHAVAASSDAPDFQSGEGGSQPTLLLHQRDRSSPLPAGCIARRTMRLVEVDQENQFTPLDTHLAVAHRVVEVSRAGVAGMVTIPLSQRVPPRTSVHT